MRLTGHTVLVTGGSSGIGRAFAQALTERGNRVAVCGRDAERLGHVERTLPGVSIFRCDLADPEEVARLAEWASRELGGLSLLINNAAVQEQMRFTREAPEAMLPAIQQEISINLAAVVHLTARLLPMLRTQPQAAVVNVTSGLALAPKKSAPLYCATKAAVRSFSKALRYQLEDEAPHVRVVEVLPPIVDTPMTAGRGRGKITPEQVVRESLRGIEQDRTEVYVGKTQLLRAVQRISPAAAERITRNW